MGMQRFGVVVGSGLDGENSLFGQDGVKHDVSTPYGDTVEVWEHSLGEGASLVVTARHLTGHIRLPSEVNYRAIVYAMKALGVEGLVGVSAVGSRSRDIEPGTLVAVSQYVDHTKGIREGTFFGDGIAAHISFRHPTCEHLRSDLVEAGREIGVRVLDGETLTVMEGPAFSTQAEAFVGQMQGKLIGMTALPEAWLAREAELCFVTLACVTDYDPCVGNHQTTAAEVSKVFGQNREKAIKVVVATAKRFLARGETYTCSCQTALDDAIMTRLEFVPPHRWEQLGPIIRRFLKAKGRDPKGLALP